MHSSVRHATLLVSRHPSLGTVGSNTSDDRAPFVAPVRRQTLCTHTAVTDGHLFHCADYPPITSRHGCQLAVTAHVPFHDVLSRLRWDARRSYCCTVIESLKASLQRKHDGLSLVWRATPWRLCCVSLPCSVDMQQSMQRYAEHAQLLLARRRPSPRTSAQPHAAGSSRSCIAAGYT